MQKSTRKPSTAELHARFASTPKVPIAALVAGALGASGFSVSIVGGLLSHNPVSDIFYRATIALALCAVAGFGVGLVFEWLVRMESARLERAATEIILAESQQIGLAVSEVESENVQASAQRRDIVVDRAGATNSKKSGR